MRRHCRHTTEYVTVCGECRDAALAAERARADKAEAARASVATGFAIASEENDALRSEVARLQRLARAQDVVIRAYRSGVTHARAEAALDVIAEPEMRDVLAALRRRAEEQEAPRRERDRATAARLWGAAEERRALLAVAEAARMAMGKIGCGSSLESAGPWMYDILEPVRLALDALRAREARGVATT